MSFFVNRYNGGSITGVGGAGGSVFTNTNRTTFFDDRDVDLESGNPQSLENQIQRATGIKNKMAKEKNVIMAWSDPAKFAEKENIIIDKYIKKAANRASEVIDLYLDAGMTYDVALERGVEAGKQHFEESMTAHGLVFPETGFATRQASFFGKHGDTNGALYGNTMSKTTTPLGDQYLKYEVKEEPNVTEMRQKIIQEYKGKRKAKKQARKGSK